MKKKIILLTIGLLIVSIGVVAFIFRNKISAKIFSIKTIDDNVKIAPLPWPEGATGNAAMANYLDEVYNLISDPRCRYMNCAIADELLSESIPDKFDTRFEYYLSLCFQLFFCGREDEAIKFIEQYEASADYAKLDKKTLWKWHSATSIEYFRYAMVHNCLLDPMEQSCIWPISKEGQFMHFEYVDKSIASFEKCLELKPDDLSSRWLLNLVYMQLGQYPDKVPSQWLIKPELLESEFKVTSFRNIAIGIGVAFDNMCGGVIMDDFNNDGLIDIFTCGWGLYEECYYLVNNGDGTFKNVSLQAGLKGYQGGLTIQQTDYNNDGFLDVWILRGAWHKNFGIIPNSLLRNNGDNTFTDVTIETGLFSCHPTQTSVWADFNNDGWLDLFIGNETSTKSDKNNGCELYLNDHGKFLNVSIESKMNIMRFVKGVSAGDYDNDGDQDIYISAIGAENMLFRNNTPKGSMQLTFTDVSEEAGISGPIKSFPCWFFDFNNDGWLDIINLPYSSKSSENDILAEYLHMPTRGEKTALYLNNKNGTFTNISKQARLDQTLLAMGCSYGDFDLDGWMDFYVGTGSPSLKTLVPNRLLRNNNGEYFQEATTSARMGSLQKGHQISFADLNCDGYPEIFAQLGGAYVSDGFPDCLFENPADFGNNWISIDLSGSQSNHAAIGARVKVTVIENGLERNIFDVVCSGSSFGANSLREVIGVGKASAIKSVEITWPTSGIIQTFNNLAINQHIKINEGEDDIIVLNLPPFQFNVPEEMPMDMMMDHNMEMGGDMKMQSENMMHDEKIKNTDIK